MFFLLPTTFSIYVLIYVLAAIIPAIFLMIQISKADKMEKEPTPLLLSLVLQGIFAALAAIVLEYIGEAILSFSSLSPDSPIYSIVTAFLIVAVAEEGCKFFFLYRRTWKDPNFNYRFDGVVYAVFVSLGFAAFENIKYVFSYGLSVAFMRAFLAVPGHMGFAVFMGIFYGRAKIAESNGNKTMKIVNMILAYLSAVCLHGFYDATAMVQTPLSSLLYIGFVVIMYIVVFTLIKRESKTDRPIY